ncbi:hypothetical protein LCGC14_2167780 [marine sediment metagenome]|uniref:Uncharacterized protein n=1 Tax=marine sediment metagenome TaxID=412755 RepID=A0A0F9DQS7_9ZZZZ
MKEFLEADKELHASLTFSLWDGLPLLELRILSWDISFHFTILEVRILWLRLAVWLDLYVK